MYKTPTTNFDFDINAVSNVFRICTTDGLVPQWGPMAKCPSKGLGDPRRQSLLVN